MKIAALLLFIFSVNLSAQFGTGLLPEPYELASSVKDVNPNRIRHRGLPSRVDFSEDMPPVGNQGQQGSCVAWSTAYATKSFQEYTERKKSGWSYINADGQINNNALFSPAFIYNQVNGGRDSGSTIFDAMTVVVEKGAVSWQTMPYSANDYRTKPTPQMLQNAAKYKAKDFRKVSYTDINEVKNQLAEGRPVVAGLLISENFNNLRGKEIYKNSEGNSLGGHAVTLVGYDDSTETFKFINSWGAQWGDGGYGYVDYKWFTRICRSAYVLNDIIEKTNNDIKPEQDTPDKNKAIDPPAEIHATNGNYSDKVVLTWSAVKNAVGYEIYRKDPVKGGYDKIGLSASSRFEDTGVQPDIVYYYRISSLSDDDDSDLSEGGVMGYAKSEKELRPEKVAGLRASAGQYSVKIELEWEPVNSVSGYYLYKWNGKAYQKIGQTSRTHFTDTRAARNGVVEYYRIAAYTGAATGDISDAVSGYTARSTERPPAPQMVKASQGRYKNKIMISWEKGDTATSYAVYKYPVKKKKWISAGKVTTNSFTDTSPEQGTIYYAVAALGRNKLWSKYSAYTTGFTNPFAMRGEKLLPPAGLSVTQKADRITLKWQPVKTAEEYNIWVRERGEKWQYLESVPAGKNSYTAALSGKNEIFLYSVTAKSMMGGDSEKSESVSVVLSEVKPAVKHRSFGGESRLVKFKGKWTGMHWDGSNVKNVQLEIDSDEMDNYIVKFNERKIYEGKYVQESPEITENGKFKIRLSEDENALSVDIEDNTILSGKARMSFLPE